MRTRHRSLLLVLTLTLGIGVTVTQPSATYAEPTAEAFAAAACGIDAWSGNSALAGPCWWEATKTAVMCTACIVDLIVPDPIPIADEVLLCMECTDQIFDCMDACEDDELCGVKKHEEAPAAVAVTAA